MKSRIWIVTLLVVFGLVSSACVVSATQYSYVIEDGNDNDIAYSPVNTISFDNIESERWYKKYDKDSFYRNQDEVRYILFNNNVTVKKAVSSDDRVVLADKSYEYDNVVDLTRAGGGNCTVKVKVSTGEWLTFDIRSCKTPLKLKSNWVFSRTWVDILDSGNIYSGCDAEIKTCVIEDPSVVRGSLVQVSDDDSFFGIYAQKPGKTQMTVTAFNGDQQTITIEVKREAFKKKHVDGYIKPITDKYIFIETVPNAKLILKIDGKKYKTKANYMGDAYKKFSKKVWRKKYTMKIKWQGHSKTVKGVIE